jgi:Arc/MetJ-type ribon-helix-helix transcriptional regulator
VFPSRAEAIRSALRDFVQKESQFLQSINADMKKLNYLNRKYLHFDASVKSDLYQTDNKKEERESFISTPKINIPKGEAGDKVG